MKKSLFILSGVIISTGIVVAQFAASQTFDEEFTDAVDWMYANDLTKYDNPIQFLPAETLTREQAAKFFGNFALYMGKTPIISVESCAFTDIANADYTLTPHITSSCTLGLFKGSQGKFMPFDTLTRAEAMTVVVRTLKGKQDETTVPWRSNYHKIARQLGLTAEDDVFSLDKPITRYEIALILYRASGENVDEIPEHQSQAQMQEVIDLLLQLGLVRD